MQGVMGDWAGKCKNNQPLSSFDLDSIQLVIKAMEGGGNVTINGVNDGHGREGGGGGRHNKYFEVQASGKGWHATAHF
jgi:hypothetical protein